MTESQTDDTTGSRARRLREAIKQLEIVREDVDDPAALAQLDENRQSLEDLATNLEDADGIR